MGALVTFFHSRENANVEEADVGINHAYKFPPRSGNYFGSHFIMGGERFDTPQPEAYLFGENSDLNFLGNRPAPFPYPPPQANEPTKTLKSLVNIRKESVRFVKAADSDTAIKLIHGDVNVTANKGISFNIEFIFDADARCAITIYYFCTEESSQNGISFSSRDSALTSETFHYESGVNQLFSQSSHIFNPNLFAEDDLSYNSERDVFPVVIHCVAEEETRQSHSTICVIDRHPDGIYALRAMKQKIYIDGLCYLLQEIYGIENKNINRNTVDDDTEDSGSECVICMSDTRDTLILPCRHLCLCNSCADSLRYQANNCPICRAPFRALLQIRAVQKSLPTGNNAVAPPNADGSGDNVPAGYTVVSLIEALNGPVVFGRTSDQDNDNDSVQTGEKHLDKKLNSPKSQDKLIKEKITTQNTPEFRMSVLLAKEENVTKELLSKHSPLMNRAPISRDKNPREKGLIRPQQQQLPVRDCVKIINEKNLNSQIPDNDDDSDAEKLSPLLNTKMIMISSSKEILNSALHIDGVEESIDDTDTDLDDIEDTIKQKKIRPVLNTEGAVLASAEDSDYYTPEDPHTTILSPLFPNDSNLEKKDSIKNSSSPLIKEIKESAISLPDSPISGNSATTRSSGDSYSSSSSTRQLLGSIPTTEIKSNDDNPKLIGSTVNV